MVLDKLKYIAVDGPIGVGKSTLARMLAEEYEAHLICENPEDNPFLPLFYEDPVSYGFQTQLFFLLSRYRQQVELKQQELFSQQVVCDYVFAKDLIFAQMNLTEDEFGLYRQIYHLLDQRLPKPDVVIFLQADADVLVQRIKSRNKDYESHIESDYLAKVSRSYSQFYFQYNDSPLMVANTSGLDLINRPQDYETLKKELFYLIKSGQSKHYVTIDQR